MGEGSGDVDPENVEAGEPVYVSVEDDYFSDAVFIGDSRTVGMFEYGGLEETAAFYASKGLTIFEVFDASIVSVPGSKKKITVEEALKQIDSLDKEINHILSRTAAQLRFARERLTMASENFDIRKLAARTLNKKDTFYILCGWMSEEDAAAFTYEIEGDEKVHCIIEEDTNHTQPPTKLKNPKLFKPFEMFVRMYGLPAYHEFDPTIFLALGNIGFDFTA